jgi:tRNA/rRNA methyltransferase
VLRGLARFLRRNPTEAERALWQALASDRRFAGRGFKRQTPIGQHVCDIVSFPLRLVIEIVPPDESAAAANTRAERNAWLKDHNYTVLGIFAPDVESDMATTLERIAAVIN